MGRFGFWIAAIAEKSECFFLGIKQVPFFQQGMGESNGQPLTSIVLPWMRISIVWFGLSYSMP